MLSTKLYIVVALFYAAYGCELASIQPSKRRASSTQVENQVASVNLKVRASDDVEIIVPLFDPRDLRGDLEGIVEEMTLFRFTMSATEGDCEGIEHEGPLTADEASFSVEVSRECDYTVVLEYGEEGDGSGDIERANELGSGLLPPSGELSDSDLALLGAWQEGGIVERPLALIEDRRTGMGKVFYRSQNPTFILKTDLAEHRSVVAHFTLELTNEGEALGLSTYEIQGKWYRRGEALAPVK